METLMSFFLTLGGALDNAGAIRNVERVKAERRAEDAALEALVAHLPEQPLAQPRAQTVAEAA
jgi:hypothetical protein